MNARNRDFWRDDRAAAAPVVWLAATLVAVLVAGGSVFYFNALLASSGCTTRPTLRVAAAPAIAESVAEVAAGEAMSSACVRIVVLSDDSAAVAASLAHPPPGAEPHVWLPESTYWIRRARARGAFDLPERGTPVAASPVVLALTEPLARQLGWPDRPVPWAALLGPDAVDVPVGLPDPASDPIGVAALVGVESATAGRPDAAAASATVLRRLAPNTVTQVAELYRRLPGSGAARGALNAFLSSEQALLRHNADSPATALVAAYPDASVPTLDFPYVVLPRTGGPETAAGNRLRDALLATDARRILGAAGFRTPDGARPAGGPDPAWTVGRVRSEPVAAVPMPDEDALVNVLSGWTGVHLSARILGVIDVSGTMGERTPGGDTRLAATIRAAQEGVRLLMDTTEVGIWLFSTRLDGDRSHRVLAPVRPLGAQRDSLIAQLGQVRVKPGGNTALYDTTLAAYQDARRDWAPGRINVVLIATDGKDDNASGINRAQLVAELGRFNDPRRPLPILFIGIGGGIDAAELNEIAAATTGGRVFLSPDPGGIRQIFFTALGDLSCQPPSCR